MRRRLPPHKRRSHSVTRAERGPNPPPHSLRQDAAFNIAFLRRTQDASPMPGAHGLGIDSASSSPPRNIASPPPLRKDNRPSLFSPRLFPRTGSFAAMPAHGGCISGAGRSHLFLLRPGSMTRSRFIDQVGHRLPFRPRGVLISSSSPSADPAFMENLRSSAVAPLAGIRGPKGFTPILFRRDEDDNGVAGPEYRDRECCPLP